MKTFNINQLSNKYHVRKLNEEDVQKVYELMIENPLYYKYCPPFVTHKSILEDMKALPPRKEMKDKYYIGYFEENRLIAVMDLITYYPNQETAFIGFFMMNKQMQGKGIGSLIVNECLDTLNKFGFKKVRLGYVKGNIQSESSWKKQGFEKTGIEVENEKYIVVVMEKDKQ